MLLILGALIAFPFYTLKISTFKEHLKTIMSPTILPIRLPFQVCKQTVPCTDMCYKAWKIFSWHGVCDDRRYGWDAFWFHLPWIFSKSPASISSGKYWKYYMRLLKLPIDFHSSPYHGYTCAWNWSRSWIPWWSSPCFLVCSIASQFPRENRFCW